MESLPAVGISGVEVVLSFCVDAFFAVLLELAAWPKASKPQAG